MATAQLVCIKVEVCSDHEDEQSELVNIYDDIVSEHEEEQSEIANINDEVVSDHEEVHSELANIYDDIVSEHEEVHSELANIYDDIVSEPEEEQSELANIYDDIVSEHEEEQFELANIYDDIVSENEEEQSELANINDEVVSEHGEEQSELANINDEVVSEHEEEQSELANVNDEIVSEHGEEQAELANINDEVVSEHGEEQSELANINDEIVSEHGEEQSELANVNDETVSEHEEEQFELVNIKEEVVSEHEEEQSELANVNDEIVSEHGEEQSELANINDETVSEHEEEQSELVNIKEEVVSEPEEEQSELANINDETVSEHEEEQSELANVNDEVVSEHEEEQSELVSIKDEVVSEQEEEQSELANINDEVVSEQKEEQSELANINDEVVSEQEEEQSELVSIKEEVVFEQEEEQSVVKSSDALTTTTAATSTRCTSKTKIDRNFQQCTSSISDGSFKNSQTGTQFLGNGPIRHKQASKTATPAFTFLLIPEAKPILSCEEYLTAWKNEKDVQLQKFRMLAYEVVALKTVLPNAETKLKSAVNSVPVRVEFNTDSVVLPNKTTFLCSVFVDKVYVALGSGLTFQEAKTNACEFALQRILMPHIRIVKIDPGRSELKGSWNPFLSPPPEPSQAPVPESAAKLPASAAMKSGCLKRRLDEQKPLQNFVVVEPIAPDCNPVIALRKSADFNDMLLEYESYFVGDGVRCAVKIEDCVLADVKGSTLESAMKLAASKALQKLKDKCWVIKIKDSDNENFKKDELSDQPVKVKCEDNDGNKLFQKISWYGGGVGKRGLEIMETVSPKNVLTRDSLGLTGKNKITQAYVKKVRQILENYAASGNQEDLVFSCKFSYQERLVFLHQCRRLNLIDGCLCQDKKKYFCIGRKRTARELVDHIKVNGGETDRYILVPPGFDKGIEPLLASNGSALSTSVKNDSGNGEEDASNRLLPADFLPRGEIIHSCPRPGSFNSPAPDILGNTPLSPQRMANSCHGPTAFRQLAHPWQGNPMISGNRFGCPIPGDSNEMNCFYNGFMGPPGFRNDQNLYNQWGVQNNSGYFQNYGNSHNGFQNTHGVGFGGLGNNWDMGNQWGDWHNNEGFQGACNSDFQNWGMHMVEFPGCGNDQRNQWAEGYGRNQWYGRDNHINCWGQGNNHWNQSGQGNNHWNQWGQGSFSYKQWD